MQPDRQREAEAPATEFASEIILKLPEPRSAEDRLMLAVLADAVALLREHAYGQERHSRQLLRNTLGWFESDDVDWPLSFRNVCGALGLDPLGLHAALERELDAGGDWMRRVRGGEVRRFPSRADVADVSPPAPGLRRPGR
ncbi:MAG: hypothetical protein KIT14_17915 [bacterium]|nr:hypothetical protein [bacterium]